MSHWTPEINQKIQQTANSLLNALRAAFIAEHGVGKVVECQVKPTEFDSEYRWWLELVSEDDIIVDPELRQLQQRLETVKSSNSFKRDLENYHKMTNIPPDKAMLVQTIDGNQIQFMFSPKISIPKSDKPRGFGRN